MRWPKSCPIIGQQLMSTEAIPGETSQSSVPDEVRLNEPPPGRPISGVRLFWVDALIVVATVLALVTMLSVWANRLLFSPDNWENTSTQLLQNSDIRSAATNYVVDQLYANVNVPAVIRSGLPPQFQGLAGPASGALRNLVVQGTELALTRPQVQNLWAKANRAADQTFIAIVNGGKGPAKVSKGAVTLDLASVVNTVAARLGLPSGLGSKLPASIANLTVFRSNQLKFVQDAGNAVRSLALWLTILVPLLYGLAIVLARGHRRRSLMTVGFAVVFAGLLGIAGRAILESQITDSLVNDASLRPPARAVVDIGTGLLGEIAGAFLLVGAVIALAAWFAGPARVMVPVRRAIAPFLREQPVATFAIAAAVMVLVFIADPIPATGTLAGIVVFMVLAMVGTEVLRRQTAAEFPDARTGDATAAIHTRLRVLQDQRHRGGRAAPAATVALPEQLERLVALRNSGELTGDEYDTAKTNLLQAEQLGSAG